MNDVHCTQAGLQQIVEDQQKMILHLEAELRKTATTNHSLESEKVFASILLIIICSVGSNTQKQVFKLEYQIHLNLWVFKYFSKYFLGRWYLAFQIPNTKYFLHL